MKVVITENHLKTVIKELFDETHVYPTRLYQDTQDGDVRTLRYEFQTKDNVTYKVLITLYVYPKLARLDFHTVSKNPEHSSAIELINTHDAIKVFNTLKSIIYKHRDEIDKLLISSTHDRVKFYEKMLNHLHIKNVTRNINGQPFITANL